MALERLRNEQTMKNASAKRTNKACKTTSINSLLAQSEQNNIFGGYCFYVKNPQKVLHYGIVQLVNVKYANSWQSCCLGCRYCLSWPNRGNRWSIGKENSNNQKIEEGQLSRIFLPMLATFCYGRTSYSVLSKTKPIYKSSRVSNLKLPSLTYKTAKVKQSDGDLSHVNNLSMT